jgi:hypothetical protein
VDASLMSTKCSISLFTVLFVGKAIIEVALLLHPWHHRFLLHRLI